MKFERILFMGFSVRREYFNKGIRGDPFPQVAAYKYEQRLLEGIKETGALVDTVVSIATGVFPRNRNVYFGSERESSIKGDKKTIALINLPVLKTVCRFLGTLLFSLSRRNSTDAIIVFSSHTPYLLSAWLNSLAFRTPFFVFILDLPDYMNFASRSWLFKRLKALDSLLISHLLKQARGLIVTTKYMVCDFDDRKDCPYLVVEGIVENQACLFEGQNFLKEMAGKSVAMYSGSVNAAHGVRELVEGFLASTTQAELWICGKGDLEDYLVEMGQRTDRVKYLGFITPEEVACIQEGCSVLVLTRNPAEAYTRYSFPSKLLEYLASGVPVLTTDLAGIPDDLRPYLNIVDEFSIEGIAKSFNDFFCGETRGVNNKARLGQSYVLRNKSSTQQGVRTVEFMRSNL